jgi:ribosomal protein S18 acetylase RimI-like enzyme
MTVIVRRLNPDDDSAEAGLIVQRAYFALPDYPSEDEYDRMLGDVASRAGDTDVIVAVDGNRILGCLTFVADHDNEHAEFEDPAAASFRYFGVDPDAQGRGIGEAMTQWCIAEARRLGKLRLRIHTLESMPAAQRLYERIGFRRDPAADWVWEGIKGLGFVFDL